MADDLNPCPDQGFVWVLIEPMPRAGHRITLGVFTSAQQAETARASLGHGLWLLRVPLDRLERI